MHLLYALFIDHTHMFWSPRATILRVYCVEEYNKEVVRGECVPDLNL